MKRLGSGFVCGGETARFVCVRARVIYLPDANDKFGAVKYSDSSRPYMAKAESYFGLPLCVAFWQIVANKASVNCVGVNITMETYMYMSIMRSDQAMLHTMG